VRLVWTTDPHLNHVVASTRQQWFETIASHGPDGIVISGDLSEGDDVVFQLLRLAQVFSVPIYFVLGNHDFYGSSISATRRQVITASRERNHLHYLTDDSAIELMRGVFLVGEDGWGDATAGDYEGSHIRLNDFVLIDDFRLTPTSTWKQRLNDLGAESAQRLAAKIAALPVHAQQVLVVTHVPPFCEACWYEGKTTDESWAPFFVCGQVGQVLRQQATSRPHCQFTVLCGHTHHHGTATLATNLVVHTGSAVYGQPDIEAVVAIEESGIQMARTADY
jgi:3',5'-cyclic-AMP phosphodiesterase